MPSPPGKMAQQTLSRELTVGIPDAGTFEDIPKIKELGGNSAGP